MNNRNKCRILIIFALLAALMSCTVFAESFTQDQIKEILSDFRSYDYGKDPAHKHTIGKIVRFIADKSWLRSFTERQMIALLESDGTSLATKQFICQQLWIIGSDESVAVLGRMLLDTKTVEMACYALCSNPSSAVDSVLQQALDHVPNKSKVCILNVLGDRKDGGSIERLTELIRSENAAVAQTAARALGRIGGDKAAETIQKARAAASGDMRAVLTEVYLSCAEGYVRHEEFAKALEIYTSLLDNSESLLTRRSAVGGALHTGDSRAVDIMISAMQQDEPILVATAIANSVALKGATVTQKLLAELKTAAPFTQVLLIEALAQRDDPLVKDAIIGVASSQDVRVRITAYDALAEIGDGSITTMLCNALEKAQTKTEADAIMASLLRLKGEQSSRAILNAISDSAPSTKIQLIQIIRDRGNTPALQQLFELCRSNDASVARTAFRAVGDLASYQSMPLLLDLLVDLPDRTMQAQAFRAITTVIGRNDRYREDISRRIQERLDSTITTPARCSLLRLLSVIPDDMSLQSLKTASEDSDPSVQDAAIRTLAGYPDPTAIDVLLKVFQTSDNRAHRAATLRGCVRLLKADGIPPRRAVRSYQQLVAHASIAAEKKLILSGLATVQHPAALGIAQNLMDDDAVKTEAALALVIIARNTAAIDPARAAAAAKLILGDSSHNNIHPQARAVIKMIDEYVSLFDGKSFAGWEGDTTKTWRIEDGAITAGSPEEQAPRNEFLATTREYENFDLWLKFKITGNGRVNAGVQFRTRRIPNHHEVSGYQADIGPGVDGHLYDESRRRRMLATPDAETMKKAQAAAEKDGWQIYRIRAEGDHIQLWLNGVNTVDYMEKDTNVPRTGIIALQIHGGMQAVIAYTDIKVRELPAPQ